MEKSTAIIINPGEYGLDEDKGKEVESVFLPIIQERDNLMDNFNLIISQEISPKTIQDARELRLKFVKIRTSTDKIHKAAKQFYLAGGRYVDAWKNKNVSVIEVIEDKLFEIENHYERLEAEKAEQLKMVRLDMLSEVCDNPGIYNVELMTETAFNDLLEGMKLIKISRAEQARAIEAQRLADIEAARIEQIRITQENERLRIEKEKADKLLVEEKEKADKLLAEQIKKAKAEKEKADALLADERRKADEYAAEQQREKIEAEEKAKKILAEQKEKADEEARIQKIKADKILADAKAETDRLLKEKADREVEERRVLKAKQDLKNASFKIQVTTWLSGLEMPVFDDCETDRLIREKFEGFKKWAKTQTDQI